MRGVGRLGAESEPGTRGVSSSSYYFRSYGGPNGTTCESAGHSPGPPPAAPVGLLSLRWSWSREHSRAVTRRAIPPGHTVVHMGAPAWLGLPLSSVGPRSISRSFVTRSDDLFSRL